MKFLLKAIARFFAVLPLSVALAVGRGLGWIYGSVIRYHRQDAFDALRRSFPEKSEKEIRGIVSRMYANLGMNVAEVARLVHASDEYLVTHIVAEGEEHSRGALKRGKGALILTGHIGSWDLLCTVTPRWGYPLTVITKNIKNRAVNEAWMGIRKRFGLRFVPAHNSYRACLTALRKNELVGFILDQNMISSEGVFVDFFGKPACTTPGLAYMSAQSGAPVVPVFTLRDGRGYHRVQIYPSIEPPPDREPATILAYTQRYTKILEDVIREHPDQWIWLHRRWKTRPPEPAPVTAGGNAS